MCHIHTTIHMSKEFHGNEGRNFVPGLGAHQRSHNIYTKQLAHVRQGDLYKAWTCLRKPFMLPIGLRGHSCAAHWEKFDVDKAACKQCGDLHICTTLTCETSIESDSIVCDITGLCLSQRMLTQYESAYDNNAHELMALSHDVTEPCPRPCKKGIYTTRKNPVITTCELDNVIRTVTNILLSKKSQMSIENEHCKLLNKLRCNCLRRMRQCRIKKHTPNLCELEAYLNHMMCGHRVPPLHIEDSRQERLNCIHQAAHAITALIQFMRTHCANVPTCVRQGGIVTGMLYMMRSGVTIDNITVLPRITELKRLLPLEQHLPTFFNIRAKVVTEAENVIKYNMRSVSPRSLALLAQTQCITRSDKGILSANT
jgi:hypothetical protein